MSLADSHPQLAAEWHPDQNDGLTANEVSPNSHKKVWWRCTNDVKHEWLATIANRFRGRGCPFCAGRQATRAESLATIHPEIAAQWHPTKNYPITPDTVPIGSHKKFFWKCEKGPDHEWDAPVRDRVRGAGCAQCRGMRPSVTNSLASLFPQLAAEWHTEKNGNLSPKDVVAGSAKKYWWRCSRNPTHEWPASCDNRTRAGSGCPSCNVGWTVQSIRSFVQSIREHLAHFSPAELFLLFQQNGLLDSHGKGKAFVGALTTGRFPLDEVDKFIEGKPSLVDQFVADPKRTLESPSAAAAPSGQDSESLDDITVDESAAQDDKLPQVQAQDVLGSLESHVLSSADEEAVEFLLASALAKLWRHAYRDEAGAVQQAQAFEGGEYAQRVRSRFLEQIDRARALPLPEGYAFRVNGVFTPPNLMQRHFASMVVQQRRVGNWSGTGAGKTLSAILATRAAQARLTVVCCPNSVVEGWQRAILSVFPDSLVATKTFEPRWGRATRRLHRYLVLNFESFQQADSADKVRSFAEREQVDFLVVDEIHYAKQRSVENLSQRRQLVTALSSMAAQKNPDLHVVGMSATPVINNLQEGRSLIELVTGLEQPDLDVKATVPNCMKMHQRLVTLGIRWVPQYALAYEQIEAPVDCGPQLEAIRALGRSGTPLALEQILTQARLPTILAHVRPRTLIYTHYVQGIDRLLREALEAAGWRTGFYTGEDKTGLEAFLAGDIDVLIGSSAIGTGVDGLQQVCNRLIVNVLPWTAAEFEQLKGRIFRQGQMQDSVTMVLPLTYGLVEGQRWSWCESKMQRLRFKKSVADAVVDGVVPEGHLRTPAQAYQDVMAWLERLQTGVVEPVARRRIVVPLPEGEPSDAERRRARYGDFSAMNRKWNQTRSATTHERLQANPEEWAQYHTLYRQSRADWAVVPFEEMVRWVGSRSGYVIGDFGCGEAQLAKALSQRHTVHSFDHVAIDDTVVAGDMAHVPLDDETLDVAVFSLSLMGANFVDYLREAHRTLKIDGQLHIWEATSRFSDRDAFARSLQALGFDLVSVEDKWKFTHFRLMKADRKPREPVDITF